MAKLPTYVDGIASSQAIDTAGEIVDIKGLDCSSLLGGALNWEHKSDLPAQIVGKIIDFKKIFSDKDCDTDRQKYYWDKIKTPFLYIIGRLFDDKKDSAREVAALFMDDAEHPHEHPMVGFSIEGAKINKEGMTITRSIARKTTITNLPANKTCFAEMIPADKKVSRNDPDSLFKGEIEFFKPTDKYLEFLEKREQDMEKDVGSGNGAFIGDSLAMSELAKAAPTWSHTGSGNFQHPEHGIVSVVKQPSGEFHVKHNGALAGIGGKKGVFGSAHEAGAHAGEYMRGVSQKKVLAPRPQNHPSPSMVGKMEKALDAGSMMAAPSQLTGGAALQRESLDKSTEKPISEKHPSELKPGSQHNIGLKSGQLATYHRSTAAAHHFSSENGTKFHKVPRTIVKSEWLKRAEEAYSGWEKREQFEKFMKSRMPHLTKGEVQAIGQTIALKKAIEAEKEMSKYASYYLKNEMDKGSDVLMANEKK